MSSSPIVIANKRGQFEASAYVTEDILPGVVWMRDGWLGVNCVTSGAPSSLSLLTPLFPVSLEDKLRMMLGLK